MPAAEYRKLIIIIWVIVATAMAALWVPKAWSGSSWDTDDFMRLVQVRDLLAGQAWADLTQYRLNPPDGTLMHWARLPDVPIALVTLALSPVLGERDAILTAAILVPPLYFLLFLTFFAFAARLMLGRARSPIALLVAIGGSYGIVQFVPGRVDHHGLQLVSMMAALTLLLYGLARPRWGKVIAWAGVPFALSIWIGAETLPVIVAWFVALGLAWCYAGGQLARYGAMAGLLGTVIGAAILATSQPRALWFSPACDAFSLMPVGMLGLIAIGFAGMAILGRYASSSVARLFVAGACGVAAGVAFALAFPDCLDGGFEAIDPVVKLRWLSHVMEARPWADQFAAFPFRALMYLWASLLGLAYCVWHVVRAGERGRILWGTIAVLVLATSAMVFWQIRTVSLAQSMALLPLSGLVAETVRYFWRRPSRWVRYAAAVVVLYICSISFWPSIQGAYDAIAAKLSGGSVATRLVTLPCSRDSDLAPLQGIEPAVVLSYIDTGSMILFRTPHSVLAAPYHRNNEGLRATIDLFTSNDDPWIKARMKERGIGWVVTCPGPEDQTVFKTETHDGLAERLSAGQVPDYLEQIPDPAESGMRFYRVRTGA
ncbi:hypothetical protein [Dongia deserti]|uniref:hypothetical protein n=1 Tax=Dongia deserti TaxID=2268030 RepID=UPI000E65C341|nr:hypothetical protein [Dongia deserti]